ncbi:MAG: exodeoxyribonuclease VII large subunit, partial [Vicinamibacteria bacterium]|nr:exodeoxyribonuclease VII large subunit [Vicinamibacteria bacterium]
MQGSLETEFFDLWVEGEISGFKAHTSGHWYFTLKDANASIRTVFFRQDQRLTRFQPREGMKVLARGGLTVYKPRGDVQFRAKLLEPAGQGALQAAFEQLKEKLAAEGLFAPERKRVLPRLPRRIGVVTSPTGAVIRDILNVLKRRYTNLELLLYPARVQGEGAAHEVAQGIRELNRIGDLDVIIVARGGGSLEDLQAFNDEGVARALAASRIPTISAVGHETDFTIADFVADLRAPTPSAAAELVVQAKAELQAGLRAIEDRL